MVKSEGNRIRGPIRWPMIIVIGAIFLLMLIPLGFKSRKERRFEQMVVDLQNSLTGLGNRVANEDETRAINASRSFRLSNQKSQVEIFAFVPTLNGNIAALSRLEEMRLRNVSIIPMMQKESEVSNRLVGLAFLDIEDWRNNLISASGQIQKQKSALSKSWNSLTKAQTAEIETVWQQNSRAYVANYPFAIRAGGRVFLVHSLSDMMSVEYLLREMR